METSAVTAVPADYEAFVLEHLRGLSAVAFRLTGDVHDAQDVVQDVLAKALVKWSDVRRADDVWAYVRRMVYTTWISLLRRRRIGELVDHDLVVTAESARAGDERLLDRLEHQEVRERLWTHLRRLPPAQRRAVVLRYYEDLSHDEIAALVGTTAVAVRVNLHRATARLRLDLADERALLDVVA